ncbi:unnamed protein product, partial [Rotaria sp. Silwood1]
MEQAMKTVCSEFVADKWSANKCQECFQKREDHENESPTASDDRQVATNTRSSSVSQEATHHPSSNHTKANGHLFLAAVQE